MIYPENFDVIVVGGGHAGSEACLASARMGLKTLLLTHNIETIGQLSCNPSIGGIGKGQLIKEIDALGGAMATCADKAAINIKILNRSKGAAMYGHHAVLDRQLYKQSMREIVENQPNLYIFQQAVEDVLLEGDKVKAVVTQLGIQFNTKALVLTAGTFLNGLIHVGLRNHSGGRAGEVPSIRLAEKLKELKLPQGRLKTGTPARIAGNSIDFSKLDASFSDGVQTGDMPIFSFMGKVSDHPEQIPCYYTRTNQNTHDILRASFDQSPMFTGVIEGRGPRYCPSIEDKITRFAQRDSHQIVLEPEGLHVNEYYPNGLSTSLPFETQYHAIRSMTGLENAHLTRPGYAIEYDFYEPTCLKQSLETKAITGLFMAGQIIGTTGYSEAAAMGLLAGINAGLFVREQQAWIPQRHEAYLGVMLDDLTTKGINEPYRVFTSRAEYRLSLREDNADERLTPQGHKLGLVSTDRWNHYCTKQEGINKIKTKFKSNWLYAGQLQETAEPEVKTNVINGAEEGEDKTLASEKLPKLSGNDKVVLFDWLKRPEGRINKTVQNQNFLDKYPEDGLNNLQTTFGKRLAEEILQQVEINAKYEGYIIRQQQEIAKMERNEKTRLPSGFDYNEITQLSHEVKQKMNLIQPTTIGQASRINGVTPAALSFILIYLKKQGLLN